MAFLIPADLEPFADIESAKALQMIDDAEALAMLAAPCLGDVARVLTEAQSAAVRAILRGAILRWNDAGSGAVQQGAIDDFRFATDTRQPRRGMFWPTEIVQLQNICGESKSGGAFSIDQVPPVVPSLATRPDLWFQYAFPVPPDAP